MNRPGIRELATRLHAAGHDTRRRAIVGALSLCLVAGMIAIMGAFSQEGARNGVQGGNTEGDSAAIERDWDKQITFFAEFKPKEEIPSYYHHIWFNVTILMEEPILNGHTVLHSVHEDANPPYAVLLLKKREKGATPFIVSLPKEMFKEGNWDKAKSFRQRGDFATRWNYEIPGPPTMRLPIARTLTSNDGRQIEGIVLARSTTSIRFRRPAARAELTIPITMLSESDQNWIMQTSRAPRILAVTAPRGYYHDFVKECVKLGYDVEIPPVENHKPNLAAMTEQELQRFDIIILEDNLQSEKRFSGVIIRPETREEQKRREKLKDDRGLTTQGKTVILHKPSPEIMETAIATAAKLAGYKPL